MIFSKELEKLAEEYGVVVAKNFHDRIPEIKFFGIPKEPFNNKSDFQTKSAFIAGAAALENLIMKSGSEFDGNSINEYIITYIDVSGQSPSYEEVAKYQFESAQLIIGGLRMEIERYRLDYEHMVLIKEDYFKKIKQLEAKLKELQNGKS